MGKPTSHTLKPLPVWCLRALISSGTSDGSLNAKSLAKPLGKKQADRLLEVDRKCREMRSKEMKRRNKITQEIVSKSPPKRKVRSIYVPSAVVDVVSPVKSISKKSVSNNTAHRQHTRRKEKAEIAGKSILGLSKQMYLPKS